MNILFIGCVESSYILLKELLEKNAPVVGVITKSSSSFNSDFFDLVPLCEKYHIKYLCVKNINDQEGIHFAQECNPDIAFCFGWSQLLKEEFLKSIPKGVVGFHPAKLPYNKGRHPIIWALVLGLTETASTFFMMDCGADTGAIVSQNIIKISYEDNARTLYDKIMCNARKQVIEIYEALKSGKLELVEQKPCEGNVWRKRGKCDGEIDWRMSSRNIYNLVRALTRPYVGAHFVYKSQDIKVWKVKEIFTEEYQNIEPGKVLAGSTNGYIDVKTGDNIIRILESNDIEISEGEYL